MTSSIHKTNVTIKPRFLVLRGGSVGDFILTLPALAALRRQWPDAYIELTGYPHIAELAVAGGLVDKVVSLESANIARYFAFDAVIEESQACYIKSFDLIISYLYDPGGTVKENMLKAGARQVIYGSPMIAAGHAIDILMKPLETLAIYPEGTEFSRLTLVGMHREKGVVRRKRVGEKVVAIHPGSGSSKKNWPLVSFIQLAERLRAESGCTPVFTLGEADGEIAVELDRIRCDIPIVSSLPLIELAEFLSACVGYVGNDSGITHLAASLGLPVVAVFGPTDPEIWAPRGPNIKVIQANGSGLDDLRRISVAEVCQSVSFG